jgi:double zinc ribbon protein
MIQALVAWLIMSLVPAAIAHRRGLDFVTWWIYGALAWPVALIHVFFATPASVKIFSRAEVHTCPFCDERVQAAAVVCKHCGRELPQAGAPPSVARDGCRKCGRRIFPGSVRCGFCGAAVTVP